LRFSVLDEKLMRRNILFPPLAALRLLAGVSGPAAVRAGHGRGKR
jgi:hypothetical protein